MRKSFRCRESCQVDDNTSSQFGNMLVLAATYRSRHLSWLVTKDELLTLLRRTIDFLSSLAPISTTLAVDAQILAHIKERIVNGVE